MRAKKLQYQRPGLDGSISVLMFTIQLSGAGGWGWGVVGEQGRRSPDFFIFFPQCPECKSSHYGQFPATNLKSLNVQSGMKVYNQLSCSRVRPLQHTSGWTTLSLNLLGSILPGEWRASLQCKRERFEWWVCLQNPGERMSLITFQTENISHHSESELFYPLIGSCRIKK